MNCVKLHLVGHILEYIRDARTHERQSYKNTVFSGRYRLKFFYKI